MMALRKLAAALFFLAQAWFLLQAGCSGTPGGSAGPPSPLAELPSEFQIPNDLSINVDKTRSEGSLFSFVIDPYADAAIGKLLSICGNGTLETGEQCDDANAASGDGCSSTCQIENFSEEIAFSANLVFFANARLQSLLGPLSVIRIPIDPERREMEQVIFIGLDSYIARLDFSDFDLDGDGVTEGCAGHTAALPVCVRTWVDDGNTESRLFAARFDAYPLPENPGAGSLRGEDIVFGGLESSAQVAANYDHQDPEDKFTDSFFGFLDEDTNAISLPIRAFASQLGPDATALKTTNGNSIEPTTGSFAKGFGRWLEDQDYWLGSFSSDDPLREFRNQCAEISTGDGVSNEAFCAPLGLSLSGLDFLPFTTSEDVRFFDFPANSP